MKDAFFGHLFLSIPGFGQATLRRILTTFGNFQVLWEMGKKSFQRIPFSSRLLSEFFEYRKKVSIVRESRLLENHHIELLSLLDERYPPLLKHIPDAPALLYARGNTRLWNYFPLAMVGVRKISDYGQLVSTRLVQDFSGLPLILVSGLALGVDSFIHRLALEHHLPTVAILGGGLADQIIYPSLNRALAKRIISENGLLLSEYPPFMHPRPNFFPERNRIIAGMSHGVVVVEAAHRSGALITAQLALDYNRVVMAVPGSIFYPQSKGCNSLLQKGALLVRNGQDIIDALQLDASVVKIPEIKSHSDEGSILQLLTEPKTVDQLIQLTNFPSSRVLAILTQLEMDGRIISPANNFYVLK